MARDLCGPWDYGLVSKQTVRRFSSCIFSTPFVLSCLTPRLLSEFDFELQQAPAQLESANPKMQGDSKTYRWCEAFGIAGRMTLERTGSKLQAERRLRPSSIPLGSTVCWVTSSNPNGLVQRIGLFYLSQ